MNAAEVYVYTREGAVIIPSTVPQDVVRVRIDPSVLVIQHYAFPARLTLQEVEFHDSLREIGDNAFHYCTALKEIVLHDGLREICHGAFSNCTALTQVHVSDGVERIGENAFSYCKFTKFRSPPLVTTISAGVLQCNKRLFSLEVSKNIIRVRCLALRNCYSLRNIALSSNTVVEENAYGEYDAFINCTDLLRIFDTVEAIANALKIRFDEFPVHSSVYYKSHHSTMTSEGIRNTITNCENRERDPTGLQQDCLGMTPLHILACSTVHSLELYQVMIENYPENLIVEDAWEAVPLLYAVWGDAPNEIVQFLVNSYQSRYPDHEFDWNDMVVTLGRANASKAGIRNLLNIQQTLSPEYNIDWPLVLRELGYTFCWVSKEIFCFLTKCSIATRVNAIGVKYFRDAMDDDWSGRTTNFRKRVWRDETETKLEYYEHEYRKLKESASLLELALWKARIDDSSMDHGKVMDADNKKLKIDPSEFRPQCRISCGADHVIENVLPYLLPSDYMRSYVPDEDDNDDGSSDDDYYSDEVDDDEEVEDDNDDIEDVDDEDEN